LFPENCLCFSEAPSVGVRWHAPAGDWQSFYPILCYAKPDHTNRMSSGAL